MRTTRSRSLTSESVRTSTRRCTCPCNLQPDPPPSLLRGLQSPKTPSPDSHFFTQIVERSGRLLLWSECRCKNFIFIRSSGRKSTSSVHICFFLNYAFSGDRRPPVKSRGSRALKVRTDEKMRLRTRSIFSPESLSRFTLNVWTITWDLLYHHAESLLFGCFFFVDVFVLPLTKRLMKNLTEQDSDRCFFSSSVLGNRSLYPPPPACSTF